MIWLFIALQIVDAWTTYRIISNGGSELNPVVAEMIDAFGVIPALLIAKGVAVGGAYLAMSIEYAVEVLCVIYLVVVVSNINQMKKQGSNGQVL